MALLMLNYFDRQTLSILKPIMKDELAFDDEAYSLLTFAFMLPYIVMYVVSGRLIDRFGTRLCMTLFAVGWSIANIASGLSHSFSHLAASRVLMGADRKSVVWGERVSVGVDLGGRGIIKKKTQNHQRCKQN